MNGTKQDNALFTILGKKVYFGLSALEPETNVQSYVLTLLVLT